MNWEYKIEYIGNAACQDRLNELGAEGWELVAKSANGESVFKRAKPVAVSTGRALQQGHKGRETVRT